MKTRMGLAVLVTYGAVCDLAACAPRAEREDDGERDAIVAVLDDWHAAAAAADEARYFGHLSDDAVFLGTDASERWSKDAFRAYAHPHFAKGKAWTFRATRRDIAFAQRAGGGGGGDAASIAWFDEDLATENLGPARGSGVLVKRGGRWRIAHYNLALTIPNDRFDLVKEAAAAPLLEAREADPLAALAFMSGAWVATRDDTTVEETWSSPGGGTMLGFGRTVAGDATAFFELLRIAVVDGVPTYIASPRGGPTTSFPRVAGDAGHVVFENRAHDWPERITYRRVRDGLEARVEGGEGEPVETWTYRPAVVSRAK